MLGIWLKVNSKVQSFNLCVTCDVKTGSGRVTMSRKEISHVSVVCLCEAKSPVTMNDGQEAFKKFTRQLRVGGGNKFPGGGGLFAGSGLLFALAAGGIALNSALFNGTRLLGFSS